MYFNNITSFIININILGTYPPFHQMLTEWKYIQKVINIIILELLTGNPPPKICPFLLIMNEALNKRIVIWRCQSQRQIYTHRTYHYALWRCWSIKYKIQNGSVIAI